MFSEAYFCGQQKHFCVFPSDYVNIYLLSWVLCVSMNIYGEIFLWLQWTLRYQLNYNRKQYGPRV